MTDMDELRRAGLMVCTAEQRPDLWERSRWQFDDVWPEYNMHGNRTGEYFGQLVPRFARFQVLLVESDGSGGDRVIGRGRAIPFRWDRSLGDLPTGIDAVGLRAVTESAAPTTLSALAAEVELDRQGEGLSRLLIKAMARTAADAGLDALVAPVRPSLKDRYPLIPIADYARWCRDDGLPFDPWMRVHARIGGTILRAEPRSMEITAPVADWERWTGMRFPRPGEYVFPGGLAPLTVSGGAGEYWEPNVWMLHEAG